MEPGKLGLAQQTVEDVTHLMEESDNIIMKHQRRSSRGLLGEIGNHGHDGVVPLRGRSFAVKNIIAENEGPNGSVGKLVALEVHKRKQLD